MSTMNLRLPLTTAALAASAVALAVPASAGAKIAYQCAPNICTANDDGTDPKQVTTNGNTEGNRTFFGPDISADGNKIAFYGQNSETRGAFVLDLTTTARTNLGSSGTPHTIAIDPAGARVAYSTLGGDGPFQGSFCFVGSNGTGESCIANGQSAGTRFDYGPDGRLYAIKLTHDGTSFTSTVCRVHVEGAGNGCEANVIVDPARTLSDLSVSPDGKFLVAVSSPEQSFGKIVLYNLQTGQFVRELSTGGTENSPTFTQDGSRVLFVKGINTDKPGIWSIAPDGAAGSEKLIIDGGRSPSAGGPSGIVAASALAAPSSQKGSKAKGSVVVGNDGSKVVVTLKSGSKTFGSLSKSNVKSGKYAFTVKLNAAGKKALKGKKSIKLKLVVAVTPKGGTATTVQKSVTIKP
jgi:WD40 repeat protein